MLYSETKENRVMGQIELDASSWRIIGECLEDIAGARRLSEFYDRVITSAGRLVPSELGAICFRFEHGMPRWVRGGPEGLGLLFNERFRYVFPNSLLSIDRSLDIYTMDFKEDENSEYVRDFLRPIGIGTILGAISGNLNISVLRKLHENTFSPVEMLRLSVLRRQLEGLHRWVRQAESELPRPEGLDFGNRLPKPLSSREAQVAFEAARGLSSREIGLSLDMSPRTAERHLANIYEKLGISCREELRDLLADSDGKDCNGYGTEDAPAPCGSMPGELGLLAPRLLLRTGDVLHGFRR